MGHRPSQWHTKVNMLKNFHYRLTGLLQSALRQKYWRLLWVSNHEISQVKDNVRIWNPKKHNCDNGPQFTSVGVTSKSGSALSCPPPHESAWSYWSWASIPRHHFKIVSYLLGKILQIWNWWCGSILLKLFRNQAYMRVWPYRRRRICIPIMFSTYSYHTWDFYIGRNEHLR